MQICSFSSEKLKEKTCICVFVVYIKNLQKEQLLFGVFLLFILVLKV